MFGIDDMIGAGLNYVGARQANKATRKMAKEQMGFQQASTREQMDFQERMSNTAYQRAMADMTKAGLNPILAFQQGGASTPSGASAQGASATMQNELSGAVSSAIEMRRASAELKNLKAQNAKLNAETSLTKTTDSLAKTDLPKKRLDEELYKSKAGMFWRSLDRVMNYFKFKPGTGN